MRIRIGIGIGRQWSAGRVWRFSTISQWLWQRNRRRHAITAAPSESTIDKKEMCPVEIDRYRLCRHWAFTTWIRLFRVYFHFHLVFHNYLHYIAPEIFELWSGKMQWKEKKNVKTVKSLRSYKYSTYTRLRTAADEVNITESLETRFNFSFLNNHDGIK